MPLISHGILYWATIVTALSGQFMLDANPRPAILLCGAALVLSLLDGWWYLSPIGSNWWYPALFGVVGMTMWQEPRGWFFMAWAAVTIGTGLRAEMIYRRLNRVIAEERARVRRLEEMGFAPDSPFAGEPDEEPVAVQPPTPVPVWRYPVAIAMGLAAAWAGAWCTRIVYHITTYQLDILAFFIGYLVGKAVVAGAGDRSNRLLQVIAALLGGAGVLYGRFLLLRWVLFERVGRPYSTGLLIAAIRQFPGQLLGFWLLLCVVLGAWMGWRYAAVRRDSKDEEAHGSRSA